MQRSQETTLSLHNFVAEQSCLGNCQFPFSKQSPKKHDTDDNISALTTASTLSDASSEC